MAATAWRAGRMRLELDPILARLESLDFGAVDLSLPAAPAPQKVGLEDVSKNGVRRPATSPAG